MSQPPLLDVRGFSLEFRTRSGTVRALEGVDLTLRKGEIVGLVGESGSGKSVLSYALLGIIDAAAQVTAGTAVFGGMDLRSSSMRPASSPTPRPARTPSCRGSSRTSSTPSWNAASWPTAS